MKKKTIKEVIINVLKEQRSPLTGQEIYSVIDQRKLYDFKSKSPVSIIISELRKNTQGIDIKKSSKTKFFKITEENRFTLI